MAADKAAAHTVSAPMAIAALRSASQTSRNVPGICRKMDAAPLIRVQRDPAKLEVLGDDGREKLCTARFNNNGLESARQPTPELEFSSVAPSRRPCASIRFLPDSALALVPIERAQRVSRHPADYLRRFGKVGVMPGQRSLREAQLSDGISVRTTRRLGLAQALLHLRQKVMA